MNQNDTICAIVTGIGVAGVSIIKISGDDAIQIAEKIWRSKKNINEMPSHTFCFGRVFDPEKNKFIDEGLLLLMKAPSSYTGEDVVELQVHGSWIGVTYITELLIKYGARYAEPGEFTKRAFLNGKLDLIKAEGIIDLIESNSRQQLSFASSSIGGKNSDVIYNIIDDLIELIAYMEASIDFPEDDVPALSKDYKIDKLQFIFNTLNIILDKSNKGKYLTQGINLLIIGEPNVGKSSLLNMLLNEDRAIVSDIPGTTRDTIEESLVIGKLPVKIVDSAGIRNSDDIIEKLGIDKTKNFIDKADFIVYMLDASLPYKKQDDLIYDLIKEKEKIILLNKVDLIDSDCIQPQIKETFNNERILYFSTNNSKYLIEFEKILEDIFLDSSYDYHEGAFITNSRQKGLLEQSLFFISQALHSSIDDMQDDFITIDLYDAKKSLEEMVGIQVSSDILDQIFSKFCIGK